MIYGYSDNLDKNYVSPPLSLYPLCTVACLLLSHFHNVLLGELVQPQLIKWGIRDLTNIEMFHIDEYQMKIQFHFQASISHVC